MQQVWWPGVYAAEDGRGGESSLAQMGHRAASRVPTPHRRVRVQNQCRPWFHHPIWIRVRDLEEWEVQWARFAGLEEGRMGQGGCRGLEGASKKELPVPMLPKLVSGRMVEAPGRAGASGSREWRQRGQDRSDERRQAGASPSAKGGNDCGG
jgi:hypothetical protein